MRRAEQTVLVLAVTAAAAVLRLCYVGAVEVDDPLRFDAGQYARYAANLQEHGIFSLATTTPPPPDSFRSPGYPVLLAGCRLVFGPDGWYRAALWLQALLSVVVVPLTFWLARSLLPFGAALGAAIVTAASPHLVAANGYVLTEAMSALLVTVAFAALRLAQRRASVLAFAGAGTVFGLLAMVNEAAAPLAILVGCCALRSVGGARTLALVAAALLPVAAWQVRNAAQDLAATGAQRALMTASHGSYPDLFFATEESRNYPYAEDPEQPAFGASWTRFRSVLGRRIAERPGTYARWYLFDKPRWLWRWDIVQGAGDVYVYPVRDSVLQEQPVARAMATGMRWLHAPFVLLCLLGAGVALVTGRSNPHGLVPRAAAAALCWFTAVYSLFLPDPRYLVPLRPLQAVLAAAGVVWLVEVRRAWRRAGTGAAPARRPADDGGPARA